MTSPSRAKPRLSSNINTSWPSERARNVVDAISASSCLICARNRSSCTLFSASCAFLRAYPVFCTNRFWRAARLLLRAVSAASAGNALLATNSSARAALRARSAACCSAKSSDCKSLLISALMSIFLSLASASCACSSTRSSDRSSWFCWAIPCPLDTISPSRKSRISISALTTAVTDSVAPATRRP